MTENNKIKYVPAEITVISSLPDIITVSLDDGNGFDGEADGWE